jgi:hypothetical protein
MVLLALFEDGIIKDGLRLSMLIKCKALSLRLIFNDSEALDIA